MNIPTISSIFVHDFGYMRVSDIEGDFIYENYFSKIEVSSDGIEYFCYDINGNIARVVASKYVAIVNYKY